jgi:hypothetical protein
LYCGERRRSVFKKRQAGSLLYGKAKTPKRFLASGSLFIQMVGEIHDRKSRDAVASSRLVRAGFWQVTGWSNPVVLNRMLLSAKTRDPVLGSIGRVKTR